MQWKNASAEIFHTVLCDQDQQIAFAVVIPGVLARSYRLSRRLDIDVGAKRCVKHLQLHSRVAGVYKYKYRVQAQHKGSVHTLLRYLRYLDPQARDGEPRLVG